MNIAKNFGIAFLTFFGVFLLYFNLCIVLEINPLPGFWMSNYTNRWNSDWYFGFDSIFDILDEIPESLSFAGLDHNLELFQNSLGGLANTFQSFDSFIHTGNVLELIKVIVSFITAPIQAIFYVLVITAQIFMTIINLLAMGFKMVNGFYNSPVAPYQTGLDTIEHVVTLSVDGSGQVVWY